jgi:NAD+ synthase (glutamine-hydrolysing)
VKGRPPAPVRSRTSQTSRAGWRLSPADAGLHASRVSVPEQLLDFSVKLALAQINPVVGDIRHNAAVTRHFIERARDAGADLVVLPELCLCGYPPKDLLLREGFIDACEREGDALGASASAGLTVVLGLPMKEDRPGRTGTTNSLVAWRDGHRIARYDKRLLPTYDVFDEDRYFEPGGKACVIDVPVRSGVTVRVGLAICEDLWQGEDAGFSSRYLDAPDPVAAAVQLGATVLAVPSASPFVLAKAARHRAILRRHASRHGIYVASVNQVGGNDDLIFAGHACVIDPRERLIGAAAGFREDLLITDIPPTGGAAAEVSAMQDPLSHEAEQQLFEALVLGVRDYCSKTGFKQAIIGLSGGIDSALTAAIAARALGPENILGVAMPGPYSSEHSVSDAEHLAANLGVRLISAPIALPMAGFRAALDDAFDALDTARLGAALPDLAEENLQSRIRGTLLMGLSNRTGAIVLTTGNKSELAVGYCTLYGDMNGGLAVLSDVTKRRVYAH